MAVDCVPVMKFYGMGVAQWDGAGNDIRDRMLATHCYLMQLHVDKVSRKALQDLSNPEQRLQWVEEYVDNEARREACLIDSDGLPELIRQLKCKLKESAETAQNMHPMLDACQHPFFHIMVGFCQRALRVLEIETDAMTAAQLDQLRAAAQGSCDVRYTHQVAQALHNLVVAFKPMCTAEKLQ